MDGIPIKKKNNNRKFLGQFFKMAVGFKDGCLHFEKDRQPRPWGRGCISNTIFPWPAAFIQIANDYFKESLLLATSF